MLAEAAHAAEGFWDSTVELLKSADHWAFEIISGLVFSVPISMFVNWRQRRHDRTVHGIDRG